MDVQEVKVRQGLSRLGKPLSMAKSASGGLRVGAELFQKLLSKDTDKAEAFLWLKAPDKAAGDKLFAKLAKAEKPGKFEAVRAGDTDVLARITAAKQQ